MQFIDCRVIIIRHSPDQGECIYAIIDKRPLENELIYDRSKGRWACCQYASKGQLNDVWPCIVATNNEKYDLPRIPKILADALLTDREIKNIRLRLP